MNEEDFKTAKGAYKKAEKRWKNLKIGQEIFDVQCRWGDNDYHLALIKEINIKERYVIVIDRSVKSHEEKKMQYFSTRKELSEEGINLVPLSVEEKEHAQQLREESMGLPSKKEHSILFDAMLAATIKTNKTHGN